MRRKWLPGTLLLFAAITASGCGTIRRERMSQDAYSLQANYNNILRQGDAAVPELLDTLHSKDPKTRFWAMALLGDIGSTKATPALLAIVQDTNEKNRNDALRALGNIQDPAALHALIQISESELSGDPRFAKLLAITLALEKYRDPSVVSQLEKWAEYEVAQPTPHFGNSDLTGLVVRLAEAGDKKELPIYEKLFDEGHTMEPQFAAMYAIKTVDPSNPRVHQFSPMLLHELNKLSDNQLEQGNELAAVLEASRMRDKSCVPAIIALDETRTVPEFQCARALGNIGDPRAVPHLLKEMHGVLTEVGTKECAIAALGEIGDSSALHDVERGFLNGRDRNYRAVCAVAALRILKGQATPEVQAALTDAIVDSDWQPRMQVAEGLQGLPGATVAMDLAALRKDPEEAVRRAAAGAYTSPYNIYGPFR